MTKKRKTIRIKFPEEWRTFQHHPGPSEAVVSQKRSENSIFYGHLFSQKMKKRQSVPISPKILILNAPPMNDVHTKNQPPSSKNGLVRAGLRLKSVKNAAFRPFLKKCRKGDVIRSQQNLGLPGLKCRRRFSEILGPFGWITHIGPVRASKQFGKGCFRPVWGN